MSGKLVNIYHKGDSVVKLNNFIRKISAIGLKPIFESKEERKADPTFKVENFNVTDIVTSHVTYRLELDLIFDFINF